MTDSMASAVICDDEMKRLSSIWGILDEADYDRNNASSPSMSPTGSLFEVYPVGSGGFGTPELVDGSLFSSSCSTSSSTMEGTERSISIFETFDDIYNPRTTQSVSLGALESSCAFLSKLLSEPETTASAISTPNMAMSSTRSGASILSSHASLIEQDRMNTEICANIKEQCRKSDISGCWRSWERMIQSGTVPNEVTLGCMVDALVCHKDVRHAECLVNQWKHLVSPNTVVYSTLIHGWAKENNAKRALSVFNQMKSENVPCNAVTYNCMIHACVRVGDMDGALRLLESMKNNSNVAGKRTGECIRPDKFTYSTIIKGYCGRGEMESALYLFESMLAENLSPDLVIYNTLLDGCVKSRYHEFCDKLLHDMVNKWKINPNSYTLSILIKRYGRQGDLLKAFHLVEKLPFQFGFRPNAHVWTCLISACISHGQIALAENVFRSMAKNGTNNSGGGFLSNSLPVDDKSIERALSLASTCSPDVKTFETLAQGYLRYNLLDRAIELAVDSIENHTALNPGLLNQIVQSVHRTGYTLTHSHQRLIQYLGQYP